MALAAVLTAFTMAGGVAVAEIAARPSSHPAIVQNVPVQAGPVAAPAFNDGGD
jgi:hypothetical protein